MSKVAIGQKKGRSWSLTSSDISSSSTSPTPTVTTHTSTLILTPAPTPPDSIISDPFAALTPLCTTSSPPTTPIASVSKLDGGATSPKSPSSPKSPRSPQSPHSTFGRLYSFKRKMARPIQRSNSQSNSSSFRGHHYTISAGNSGLGQGATVVRTPMDATAHMQHAHAHTVGSVGRQKCVRYPSRQSSLRSVSSSPMSPEASRRRPSVGSATPTQPLPRAPCIEPALEGPAVEEERVEVQLLRSPKAQPRRLYQGDGWPPYASSSISTSPRQQSIQYPQHPYESLVAFQQSQQLPPRGSSQQHFAQLPQENYIAMSPPLGGQGYVPSAGAGLSRALSTQSSSGPQTPRTPESEHDGPEPSDKLDGSNALDIDISYHRHRLTSGTGRSSLTITAENAAAPASGLSSSLGSHHSSSFGSSHSTQPLQIRSTSLRPHRSHTSLKPSPSPRLAHAHSPSAASFTSIDEDVSPRIPRPMPRRRPSQTAKADGPFCPVVVGHSIRPSMETCTLVTLRFAFSLDTDPNTHTVTLTLDTLRPAGGKLVQFVEDALRPYSASVSSVSFIGSSERESMTSVYSNLADEGACDIGPDMTDGSSAESTAEEAEADEEEFVDEPSYGIYQEEQLDVKEGQEVERISPIPVRPERRRAPLSSCPTPLPPLAELPLVNGRSLPTPTPSPAWPSSASASYSYNSVHSGWSGASVSRESSQRSVNSMRRRRRRASTCPSAPGVVTELTVLLPRDAGAWHAIASRLCSGNWPLLDGKRKRVEAECRWAGMTGLAEELEGNPHFRAGYL